MKLCSWSNEKQLKIALSTIEAKYVVTSQATLEPMWLRTFFWQSWILGINQGKNLFY
jgi:hypothetical protein